MPGFSELDRRHALGLIAGAAGLGAAGASSAQTSPGDQMAQEVWEYDLLGVHRTATSADDRTTAWLSRRLTDAGLKVDLQAFSAPQFTPADCHLRVGDAKFEALPGWPVKATAEAGVSGPLAPADAPELAGRLASIRLARQPGGSWDSAGDLVLRAAKSGALGVVVATENPTGEIVALNADPARFDWPVPVVIVAGRHAERLSALTAKGAAATLVSTGKLDPAAQAHNVIARRPGRGPTVVVSTPKTGWFHCAGERGTGAAVFLELARRLVRASSLDLMFVAFAGHELNFQGARYLRDHGAPDPKSVAVWLHLGANVAMQPLEVKDGFVRPARADGPRRYPTASAAVLDAAKLGFGAKWAGFATPALLTDANAAGEVSVLHGDYPTMAGLLGTNPLFHTELDRAAYATTPTELENVADFSFGFLRSAARF